MLCCTGGNSLKIQESAENYLETILVLTKRIGTVRSIDIVNELDFAKPSVSVYVRNLRDNGFIDIDKSGYITLTQTGLQIAESIYERHQILTRMLISLGVDPQTAENDACRIEHVISTETFLAIKAHLEEHLPSK